MTIESSIAYFVAVIIFAITPGPGVFAVIARSLVLGWRNCLAMLVGISLSDVIYLLFACYGLSFIAEYFNELFTVIRTLGATYLIYLGWKFWTMPVDINALNTHSTPKTSEGFMHGFMQGFLISASNPKVMLFYLAFVPGFVDLTSMTTTDITLLSILTFIGIMLGTFIVAYSAASLSHFLSHERHIRRLNKTAGGMLVGVGVYIASNRQ